MRVQSPPTAYILPRIKVSTMEIKYFHEGENRLSRQIGKIKEQLLDPNRKYALKYKDYLELNDRKPMTLSHRLKELRFILKLLDKDAKTATKTDIEKVVRDINNSKRIDNGVPLANVTRGRIKLTLKTFFRWLYDLSDKDPYPDLVRWIKIDRKGNTKLPSDMLNEDDIKKLILACNNSRDRCVVAMLWDMGARIGEILNLRMKDQVLSKDGVSYVIVDGKTGQRRVAITYSIPYLANYLNDMRNSARKDDALFVVLDHNRPVDRPMDYHHVQKLLHRIEKLSKIDKHLHAHIFRHSRATYYAKSLTEQQLKAVMGWSGDSRMASTYVHQSGKDIDEAILRANGLMDKKEIKPQPQIKKCDTCHVINGVTETYCINCHRPLDTTEQINKIQEMEEIKKRFEELQDIVDFLVKSIPGLKEKAESAIRNRKLS